MKSILLLLAFLLIGCDNVKSSGTGMIVKGQEVSIVVMDSCEYLRAGLGNDAWCTHKGNCRFCKARK